MEKNSKIVILNGEQIKRLYDVFDFEENEEIISATIDSDKGGWCDIQYVDGDGVVGNYKPYLAKHSGEDAIKLNYILNGRLK